MEALKGLEVSFGTAYRELECQIVNLQGRAEDAERAAAAANSAQQATERQNQELQSRIAALQKQLYDVENKPQDLEPPSQLRHLEEEFAPEHVWTNNYDNIDELKKGLEAKYSALYTTVQTLSQGWSSLKGKVLQHKRKLQQWDKQLERNEFTFELRGAPVTFRRVMDSGTHVPRSRSPSNQTQNGNRTDAATARRPTSTAPNFDSNRAQGHTADALVTIKPEPNSQPLDLMESTPAATLAQSPSGVDRLSSEPSDTLHPLPDIKNRKRKRVLGSDSSKPSETSGQRPVTVKNEPISSSPPGNSLGQHFPSTQDLDNIGYVVQTPTKRKSQRDIAREPQEDEDERESQASSVLRRVDGNSRATRRSNDEQGNKKQKIKREPDTQSWSQQENGMGHPARPSRAESPRLSHNSTTPATTKASRSSHRKAASPPTRQSSSPEIAETQQDSCPEIRPEEEPYRSRPLHSLNLSHFKINPQGNQGMDYAYDTVVRKKDDRKCLSGCTKPGCCGDRFRMMARVGGFPTTSKAEQEKADRLILEEYLGDDRGRLERLSGEEREDLLIEAKARAMANQYGRHRHAHQRPRTPPGFWRTEMPDTQELEEDWEAAGRLEREKIEERYREAMRPGGLWMWADE